MTHTTLTMYNTRRILKWTGVVAALSVIILYGTYEFRNYFAGPQITLSAPLPGDTATEQIIDIAGEAQSIAHITLNGRPIFIDKTGMFAERLVLLPGYNRITIQAEDRFGNTTEVLRDIVFAGTFPAVLGETIEPTASTSTTTIQS